MIVNFLTGIAGPSALAFLGTIYDLIINAIGIVGFVALSILFGVLVGITLQRLWYSGLWGIRKWAIQGATKDLGATGVTSIPATPVGATTRPVVQTVSEPLPVEQPVEEKTQQ